MDRTFKFFTDTATLAVFDPQQLKHRVDDDVDWWCLNFAQLDEIRAGTITLVSLGGDGIYHTRITDGELNPNEHEYAAELVANLGLVVTSGKIFIGPGECLPGGNSDFDQAEVERGTLCEVGNGDYSVDVYAINWFDSPRWWSDDHRRPEHAPADFVVVLRPRTGPIPPIDAEPRFTGLPSGYLFNSPTRQIGPQPGMILTARVRKGPDGLSVEECGPCCYRPSLIDYSRVAWKDTIRFRVTSVDHDARTMTGEFTETVKDA